MIRTHFHTKLKNLHLGFWGSLYVSIYIFLIDFFFFSLNAHTYCAKAFRRTLGTERYSQTLSTEASKQTAFWRPVGVIAAN